MTDLFCIVLMPSYKNQDQCYLSPFSSRNEVVKELVTLDIQIALKCKAKNA
jgi:hypothetical protein